MLPGPIFRREVRAAARRRDLFVARTVLALLLGVITLVAIYLFIQVEDERSRRDPATVRRYAAVVFGMAAGIEGSFLFLLALGAVAPSIAQEREKDTLWMLLLTRLTRLELVLAKLAGRLLPSVLILLTGLPVLLLAGWFAELPPLIVVEVVAVLVGTTIVAGSLAILASARHEKTGSAVGEALFGTMLWLVGFPLCWRLLPAQAGTLWGDLLAELRRLAGWIAPSSPVLLMIDFSWISAGAGALSDRLVTMLALQGALIVLAVGGAVASLRLREPHPNAADPHRGYRPPVGDDPIFWREYVLPLRGGRMPMVVILARQMAIVLRALVLLVLQVVALSLALAVPIGLVIGAGWYGSLAFREVWAHGYGSWVSYDARDRLNLFIRGATALLGVFPLLAATAGTTDRIAIERNKKTWEPLLTTPLTGEEILSSKMRVIARSLWSMGRWLIPLWALGIACDALHPLGALVAGAELLLAVRAGVALGVWLGIRPGSERATANTAYALWSLGFMVMGGILVVGPLCSGRQLHWLTHTWNGRLLWVAPIVLSSAVLVLGGLAPLLSRRCFRHFDEWVGRPHRAAGASLGAGDRAGAGVDLADWGSADGAVSYREAVEPRPL
jgi:ABC-type transport system involved in multi-copper enzyme maturation permease subunit